jgi:PilZ domain
MAAMPPEIRENDAPPAAGTPVSLLSHNDGRPFAATVQTWMNSDSALVVIARVAAETDAVRELADQRVWMTVPENQRGFTVFSGLAQPADATSLDITGVALLVHEPRRDAARALTTAQVSISAQDRSPRQLRGVDLARGGVRVALTSLTELLLGDQVTLDVHLEDGMSVPATGQVIRVDEQVREAVVRFDELPTDLGTHIDRYVLLQMAQHN